MKAVTIAAGIDKHVVTPTTTYEDKGCTVIGGRRLCNAQGKVYGTTTVTQILERSANAGAVFVASKLGQDPLYQYLRAFGFGDLTGIDLAAEARVPYVRSPSGIPWMSARSRTVRASP